MPLHEGHSPKTFERNVKLLFRENSRRKRKRSRKQILAIAYAEARRSAEAAGRDPGWLGRKRKRRAKTRRSR